MNHAGPLSGQQDVRASGRMRKSLVPGRSGGRHHGRGGTLFRWTVQARCIAITAGTPGGGIPAAGHRLEFPVGELFAFSERRGTGKYQVNGIGRLLHRHNPHTFGKLRPDLSLYDRPGVSEQLLPEDVVLEAPLYKPLLHLRSARSFAHARLPFVLAPIGLRVCPHKARRPVSHPTHFRATRLP